MDNLHRHGANALLFNQTSKSIQMSCLLPFPEILTLLKLWSLRF